MNQSKPPPLRSITRLLIGGAMLGWEEFERQLKLWEQLVDRSTSVSPQGTASAEQADSASRSSESPEETAPGEPVSADVPQHLPAPPPTATETLRYALVGLLFDTQSNMASGLATLEQVDQAVGAWMHPLITSLATNRALSPLQERFAELVARGETEVNRLVALGQSEELHSRQLTQTAIRKTFERSIHQIAIDPEVQELVQKQGTGLASEVIEEVRERAVSVDMLMERLARSLLRRTPREDLPEPSVAIRIRAEHFRTPENEGRG